MADMYEGETPALPGAPTRARRRRFGRWLAPAALIIALAYVLAVSRRRQESPEPPAVARTTPHIIAPAPHTKDVATGWRGVPQRVYGGQTDFFRWVLYYDTGGFLHNQTDLYLSDSIPINFTRTYISRDDYSRSFGIGASDSYDIFLSGDSGPFTYIDLVMSDGARIHFHRISPGTGYADAVYRNDAGRTVFRGATIRWTGRGWDLVLRNGAVLFFPPSKGATRPGQAALLSIRDASGRRLAILRDAMGNKLQITSPSGATIWFTNDAHNRITRAQDSRGHVVEYTYDSRGRLTEVKDAYGEITKYTYDDRNDMLTITRPDGKLWSRNEYDTARRIVSRTDVDGNTMRLVYTTDPKGHVIATDVLSPDDIREQMTWNAQGELTSDLVRWVGPMQAQ
jgi:YD repeat-containing protein